MVPLPLKTVIAITTMLYASISAQDFFLVDPPSPYSDDVMLKHQSDGNFHVYRFVGPDYLAWIRSKVESAVRSPAGRISDDKIGRAVWFYTRLQNAAAVVGFVAHRARARIS